MTTHASAAPAPGSPGGWSLERRADGRLDLVDVRGRRHENVDVLRAFPITAPAGPVAIVAAAGGELAWIDALAGVDPALRALLETELAARELVPVIERIESVSDGEPAEWHVLTDRGPRSFKVRHADDIARPTDGSATITDTVGMRYVIPDLAKLGASGRRLFEKMI
ncbi:MAG: DUF1854 domain-containing protein [Planctomycetaceae bacterium]